MASILEQATEPNHMLFESSHASSNNNSRRWQSRRHKTYTNRSSADSRRRIQRHTPYKQSPAQVKPTDRNTQKIIIIQYQYANRSSTTAVSFRPNSSQQRSQEHKPYRRVSTYLVADPVPKDITSYLVATSIYLPYSRYSIVGT